jgi:N-acetylmuramoyl-L-alanine amidase
MKVYRRKPSRLQLAIAIIIALALGWTLKSFLFEAFGQEPRTTQAEFTPNVSGKVADPNIAPPGRVFKVMIDPGHGGEDPGATGRSGEEEKISNLAIALQVVELLKDDPTFELRLTRTDDTYVGLEDRAAMANEWQADILISIHDNSYEDPSVSGTETFYRYADGKELASIIHQHIVSAIGIQDRGVKEERLEVLTFSQMPAILIEPGFLTNAADEAVIIGKEGQTLIAQAVVDGLKQYFQ